MSERERERESVCVCGGGGVDSVNDDKTLECFILKNSDRENDALFL